MQKKTEYSVFSTRRGLNLIPICCILIIACYSCELTEDTVYDTIFDTWKCKESSEEYGESTYLVDISQSYSDNTEVILDNFYNLGFGIEVVGNLSGQIISLPVQVVDGNTISGTGNIASDLKRIDFSYTVNDGSGTIDHITAVYTRE